MTVVGSSAGSQMAMHEHEHATSSAAVLRAVVDNGDLVLELGPVDLPARAGHDEIKQPPPLMVPVGVDGWLHGYTIELVDSAGRTVPQTVVHHVNVIIPQKRELFSPIMQAFDAQAKSIQTPAVVFFKYFKRPKGLWRHEQTHNIETARIDDAKLVRARDLGRRNLELIKYYGRIQRLQRMNVIRAFQHPAGAAPLMLQMLQEALVKTIGGKVIAGV